MKKLLGLMASIVACLAVGADLELTNVTKATSGQFSTSDYILGTTTGNTKGRLLKVDDVLNKASGKYDAIGAGAAAALAATNGLVHGELNAGITNIQFDLSPSSTHKANISFYRPGGVGTERVRFASDLDNSFLVLTDGIQIYDGNTNLSIQLTANGRIITTNTITGRLSGTNLTAGTVNSNALDTATAAQLALAGTGTGSGSPQTNISYVAVTNAPWLLPNGDGSQLTGILATNTTTATWTNSGSVDSNMVAHIYANPRTWEIRRPTDGFCTYPSSTYTEAQVIQAASNMWVRGYVAAGMDLFELSDGWGNTNRTAEGALLYNTNNFPSGMPWVVEHCRTNYGVKIGFYLQGANNVTNTVSVWGSIPTTDFAHLDQDMNTIVGEWGASHIRSDWFGFDNWDVVRAFVERLTYVADYAGKTNIYNQRPISFQWFTDLPVWWDAGEPSAVPPFMADYVNVMRVGSDHSSRELVLSGLEFMKHYFHLIGPGHYIFTDTEMDSGTISGLSTGEIRRNIGLGALMHSPLQFTWNGLATDVPTYTYKEEWFTNSRLRDIRWDAAVNPPTIAYTNLLSGTNAGECWITKLQNGDYAVALWNRANTGGSLSNRISIEQAGLNSFDPQNGTYWTRDATSWTNANGYTLLNDPSGTDRGIYWWTTNTQYGMSYYYLDPALTNVNGAEWIATNGFVNGGSMKVFYDQGREMSFGTTNIAALGTSGWTYRDLWTGFYGMATNFLTWSVPTNDLALFRVSAPAIWPVAATATGNIDGSNIVSGTVAPARLGSGSSITTKYLRGDSTWQTLAAGSGDMLAANNLSDVVNAGTARTNIAAHNASNLTTGTVGTNLLPVLLAANVTGAAATVTTITEAQITNALGATLQKNITGNAGTATTAAQLVANNTVSTIQSNSLGTTIVPAFWMTNGAVAALGAQQASPAFMFGGQGWRSGNSTTMPVQMGMYVLPVQGSTANPLAALHFVAGITNADLATVANINSSGTMSMSGAMTATSGVIAGAGGYHSWSGRAAMYCTPEGMITLGGWTGGGEAGYGGSIGFGNAGLTTGPTTNWPALRTAQSTNNPTLGVYCGTNNNFYASLMASNLTATATVIANAYTTATNAWDLNTTLPWGTNSLVLTSGAATGGIIGISGFPTSTEGSVGLLVKATGNMVFTNAPGFVCSDFTTSRTITNGNFARIGITLTPGVCTNMDIVQYR